MLTRSCTSTQVTEMAERKNRNEVPNKTITWRDEFCIYFLVCFGTTSAQVSQPIVNLTGILRSTSFLCSVVVDISIHGIVYIVDSIFFLSTRQLMIFEYQRITMLRQIASQGIYSLRFHWCMLDDIKMWIDWIALPMGWRWWKIRVLVI